MVGHIAGQFATRRVGSSCDVIGRRSTRLPLPTKKAALQLNCGAAFCFEPQGMPAVLNSTCCVLRALYGELRQLPFERWRELGGSR